MSHKEQQRPFHNLAVMILIGPVSLPLTLAMYYFTYRSYATVVATVGLLVVINLAFHPSTRGLLERRAARLAYRG